MLSGNHNNVDIIIPKSSIFGRFVMISYLSVYLWQSDVCRIKGSSSGRIPLSFVLCIIQDITRITLIIFNVHILNLCYITCL